MIKCRSTSEELYNLWQNGLQQGPRHFYDGRIIRISPPRPVLLQVVQTDNPLRGIALEVPLGLCAVLSQGFELPKVIDSNVPGNVARVEHGTLKVLHRGIELRASVDEVLEALENDPVRPDFPGHVLFGPVVRHELRGRRHVDAVHVRISAKSAG